VKESEEEVFIITVQEVLIILIAVILEKLMVWILIIVEAETLMMAVVEVEMITITVAKVDTFTAAVVKEATFTAFVGAEVSVPLETTRIIQAITKWYQCPEHRKTVKDQDAAYPSVSPRRDRGLVFED